MRWFRRIFLIVCLVATCLIVWAAVYARKQGFTRSWRDAIESEFEKRGYYVDIGKLTLGAFRGLVAEDVRFYQDPSGEDEIAFLNDVYLDVDLSNIFNHKQISINTLDVQDAKLSLPLDVEKPYGKRIKIENLSGRVVITESVIEILHADASFAGIDLDIKGSLLRPPTGEAEEEPTEEEQAAADAALAARRQQLLGVLKFIESFEFPGERPEVKVEFRGDLDDLATTTARAEIKISETRRKRQTYGIESLTSKIRFDGLANVAEIEELIVRDTKGSLALTGKWTQEGNRLDLSLESDADLSSLAGMFYDDKRLREVVFFHPPQLQVSGHLDLDEIGGTWKGFPGEMIGQFRTERFVSRGTVFSGLDFGFSVAGDRYYIRSLRLDHKTGVAFLNLKYEPGSGNESVRYQAEVKLDPKVFRPFLNEKGRKFLDSWSFTEQSSVYLAGAGNGPDWGLSGWTNRGIVDLRNFRLNGVPFQEMETEYESAERTQWFRNVTLAREEGKIVAEVAENNVEENIWEVKGVVSTVDIVEGARAFNPKLAESLKAYRFDNPPTIRLTGHLDSRRMEEVGDEPRRNELDIAFEGTGAAYYDLYGKTLTLRDPVGEIEVDGSRVHLTSLRAGTFGGSFELEYDARNVRSPDGPFDATVSVRGVPLEAVTKHYNDSDSVKGSVDTVFHLSGNSSQIATWNGHGSATISEGHLFAVPVLGPLSKLISRGNGDQSDAGHSIAREASATFQMENGVLETDDLEALTGTFRVRGAGSVSLVDRSVDFEAVVNMRDNLTGALLTPVSELLTYSCTGTIDEPEWKPKHISNLGKVPTRVISEITNIPVEGLRKLGQGIFGVQAPREEGDGAKPTAEPPLRRLFQRNAE